MGFKGSVFDMVTGGISCIRFGELFFTALGVNPNRNMLSMGPTSMSDPIAE